MNRDLSVGLPVRGLAARYAEAALYHNYNDIDVYIEDTAEGYRKLYAIVLARLFSADGIALDRVFPLGSRGQVLKAARKDDGCGRKSLFIVDGDLYLLGGEYEDIPESVFVLPRYCIENFLIDSSAILRVLYEDAPEMDMDELKIKCDFEGWFSSSRENLKELFVWFAVSHSLAAGIQTVSMRYQAICKNGDGDVDSLKVRLVVDEISRDLSVRFGQEAVSSALESVRQKVDESSCFITNYVSAKDFVLPLLLIRGRAVSGSKAANLNLKVRVARVCSLHGLDPIVERVRRLAAA
ncbi:DUF4435 domain-containing protein [Stenotrophomonas sp. 364]|uniref:DUF4435 domain-containing protein n=1 Tax=Stenotrophomonas sp. 364 TaxID=2691571 RepID=UPI001318A286|nr:DUF4435 domain-containing protein [Stenotrophomonas sp. 364]QHB69912.1 DUF4435 domain-containing protein [Stenotrophomonas sp. 364]